MLESKIAKNKTDYNYIHAHNHVFELFLKTHFYQQTHHHELNRTVQHNFCCSTLVHALDTVSALLQIFSSARSK